jgi:hypothetical protein
MCRNCTGCRNTQVLLLVNKNLHKFNKRRNCVCLIIWDGLNNWNYIVQGCLHNVDENTFNIQFISQLIYL